MKKKIIVVSMIKNEEILIESSVRYWLTFSDKIIIFDHYSTDHTSEILKCLKDEFQSRLQLYQPKDIITFYAQAQITNEMIKCAFTENNADLVLPLDADEFPYLNPKRKIKHFLKALDLGTCYSTLWMPFTPLRINEKIDSTRLFPLSFNRKKKTPLRQWPKMILSGKIYKEDPIMVTKGNHSIVRPSGKSLPKIIDLTPKMYYAHYMYQNYDHFIRKVTANWAACKAAPDWQLGIGDHYRLACEKIQQGSLTEKDLDYYALSVSGMTGESMEQVMDSIEEINPYTLFDKIKLRYTYNFVS